MDAIAAFRITDHSEPIRLTDKAGVVGSDKIRALVVDLSTLSHFIDGFPPGISGVSIFGMCEHIDT